MTRLSTQLGTLSMALALTACGVVDGGEWEKFPDPVDGTPVVDIVRVPATPSVQLLTPAPQAALTTLECALPAASGLAISDNPSFTLAARDRICFGDDLTKGPSLCFRVESFRRRVEGALACRQKVREVLAEQGRRILGDRWLDTAGPMLPSFWTAPESELAGLRDRVAAGVIHLATGEKNETATPGDPLCLLRPSGASVEESRDHLVGELHTLLGGAEKELEALLAGLRRGVELQVTEDLRLSAAVLLRDLPSNLEPVGSCRFQLTSAH